MLFEANPPPHHHHHDHRRRRRRRLPRSLSSSSLYDNLPRSIS